MKILIATDGSAASARMLNFVTSHPELFNPSAHYTVLTVVPTFPPLAGAALGAEAIARYYENEAETVLGPARQAIGDRGYDLNVVYRVGQPAAAIAEFAKDGGFTLLVMGSHGHTALGNVVLGSVVTGVLALAPVPILIVR